MTDRITVREVREWFEKYLNGSILIGDVVYGIENYHPGGMVHVWHVFGGIQEFIAEFIPYIEIYPFEESARNGIVDRQWIDHTLKKLKDNSSPERMTLERMTRKHLTDSDGTPDGQLCRFVVTMLRARDIEDEKACVTLAGLKEQPCLEGFRGEISQIAIDLQNKGVIAIEPDNKYRLRVLIPLFSRQWWEPHRLEW